eukprot:TRINITY_DN18253_c3_g2_i1.p1 TRINITY_DN18253_c3_g2~~TRINITY_DN18253_c3_g2_i1.p1  ORF type:complete len:309 (+),score=57.81 TRINITY_DN18253_c3_g2_i1:122-928(+)
MDIVSSAQTLEQLSQQIYNTYHTYNSTATLTVNLPQDTPLPPVLEHSQIINNSVINSAQKSPTLEKTVSSNVFDTAPVSQQSNSVQDVDDVDQNVEELPDDIKDLIGQVMNPSECMNISEALSKEPDVSMSYELLQVSGLFNVLEELAEEVDYTVFIANNEAIESFEKNFGSEVAELFQQNTTAINFLFSYHIIPTQVVFAGYTSGSKLETMLKQGSEALSLTLKSVGGMTVVEGEGSEALVVSSLAACNVTIYVINQILLPFKIASP